MSEKKGMLPFLDALEIKCQVKPLQSKTYCYAVPEISGISKNQQTLVNAKNNVYMYMKGPVTLRMTAFTTHGMLMRFF